MKLTATLHRLSIQQWQWLYLLLALCIACKVMYNQHGWVNTDSLLYFEQARLIAAGEWKAAYALFTWLLYPGLIAGIHQLTSLSIQTSAQCLNAVSFVLFVAGFQRLLLESGAKLRTLHWGHWLLFSTPYIVGDVLGMLLRDEGFWAAFCWGLVYCLRYLRSHTFKQAIAFQCCMLIAMLLRIEAVAYLVALPLLCLLQSDNSVRQRMQHFLIANLLALIASIVLLLGLLTGKIQTAQLGRLQEVLQHLWYLFGDIHTVIQQKAEVMGKQVLGPYLDDYARFSVWSSILLIVLYKSIKVAGLPALFCLLWPQRRWWAALPKTHQQVALSTYILGLIVSTVIILNVFVLSSRYVIAGGIIMIWLAAFAVADLQKHWPRMLRQAFVLIVATLFILNLWDRAHPDLDRLAVNYIASINPQHKPVFYDTENARFYAGQPFLQRVEGPALFVATVDAQRISDYDYYMISVSQDESDQVYAQHAASILTAQHYRLIQTLYGWHHKTRALIYVKQAAD